MFDSELLQACGDTTGVYYVRRATNMTTALLFHVPPSVLLKKRHKFGPLDLLHSRWSMFCSVNVNVNKIEKNEMGWACGAYG